ncbi:MAG: ammonium transporter [Solirubrobacterales bacterium]|nr:ammonium transporter [Solirubrobacterales bacterium]
MSRSLAVRVLALAALTALVLPTAAFAQDVPIEDQVADLTSRVDTTWVIVAAVLVMFMQAGFAFLEIGFVRGKNAGSVIAKILTNFSISSIGWWIAGFAIAFGGGAKIAGDSGFLFGYGDTINESFAQGLYGDTVNGPFSAFFFFQFVFCAVSLAIVWGTTLERIKFIVYPIYGLVFSMLIYPLIAHWIFGGGILSTVGNGVQDFAGSTVVHLTGATGALAALLLLGPRKGKYGPDGKPRAIPGHNMPLFGLGVLILWLGWFGFNPGSTLGTGDGRFAEVVIVTNLAAAAGVIGAAVTIYLKQGKLDVGMCGNGAIAALVAITAPSGYVEFWAAPIIGVVAGVLVVVCVLAIDKKLDDPVGALSAHGVAGIWGTLACGIFTSPRLAEFNAIGDAGLVYSGSFKQLGVQFVGVAAAFTAVFVLSYITFAIIKATVGLRVEDEMEEAGLDITERGMYGYPEQFIPEPELVGYGAFPASRPPVVTGHTPIPTTTEVPA